MYQSNAATSICRHTRLTRNFIETLIVLKRKKINMIINSELLKEAIADAK